MSEMNDTQRKSALVTGSSRGIGLAVASELAQARLQRVPELF